MPMLIFKTKSVFLLKYMYMAVKYISKTKRGKWGISKTKTGKPILTFNTKMEAQIHVSNEKNTESVYLKDSSGWKADLIWKTRGLEIDPDETTTVKKIVKAPVVKRSTHTVIKNVSNAQHLAKQYCKTIDANFRKNIITVIKTQGLYDEFVKALDCKLVDVAPNKLKKKGDLKKIVKKTSKKLILSDKQKAKEVTNNTIIIMNTTLVKKDRNVELPSRPSEKNSVRERIVIVKKKPNAKTKFNSQSDFKKIRNSSSSTKKSQSSGFEFKKSNKGNSSVKSSRSSGSDFKRSRSSESDVKKTHSGESNVKKSQSGQSDYKKSRGGQSDYKKSQSNDYFDKSKDSDDFSFKKEDSRDSNVKRSHSRGSDSERNKNSSGKGAGYSKFNINNIPAWVWFTSVLVIIGVVSTVVIVLFW